MIEIGTRVKVTVPAGKQHTWATNYLVALQGLTGVVQETVDNWEESSTDRRHLVLFEDPPKDPSPMAPRERKLTKFWIQDHSLTEVEP